MALLISPSVLSCDFANIQRDVEMINNSSADWFHVDVMDGVFVPNISFGFPVISAIKKHATKPLDVHLMIANPDQYIEEFKKAMVCLKMAYVYAQRIDWLVSGDDGEDSFHRRLKNELEKVNAN